MKKPILNLGKSLSKVEQKLINGGDESCPPINCYYGDTPPTMGASHCGTCQDYHNLSPVCQGRVLISHECFPR
ncbi:hypothetical protein [Tenacibaculum sp. SDUM215027]|uniref:hypothetical protein n=1 Tax=Tenacibaculum sp. SDUM215027 TaxID=3422596 RepID=UPI003D320A4E